MNPFDHRNPKLLARCLIACLGSLFISACGGGNNATHAQLSPAAKLGELIFDDQSLSASGAQACSTCHNPHSAHAPTNSMAVQLGGLHLDMLGLRAAPSLRYSSYTPTSTVDSNQSPIGGFDHDGRAFSLADQAIFPLLASFEMANTSKADVVARLQKTAYATTFTQVFGANVFDNADKAFESLQFAIQQYEIESSDFHPFNSKFDQYLRGRVSLSAAEMRGLVIFNAPNKGNCSSCHTSSPASDGTPPLFTNFGFANLGIPRNSDIPSNSDPSFFDLGACGPVRTDLQNRSDLCGSFKTPSLRNVATRKVFFHNGRFKSLTDAVTFLVQRDTNPELWYPPDSTGSPHKFNDLPLKMSGNVDTVDAPFNRKPGMAPALSSDEISDLVQFLGTLSDGYVAQ